MDSSDMPKNTRQSTMDLSPKHSGNRPSVITPSAVITALEKRPNALTAKLMSGVGNTWVKSSSALPHTTLSYKLEKQMNDFLEDNDAGVKITIRSFSNEIQRKFVRCRYRVIIAFQAIEGADVAFFILYAREYYKHGRDPSIKIEYIDSVKYFRSCSRHSLRTPLYREIVMAYLDYAGNLGFKEANLYSCAPNGKEYIFNARPQNQLEITQERLNDWYKVMFREAERRCIVENVKYSTTDMTREMDVLMDLRKTDNDLHQEENIRCPSVELDNLVNFFGTHDELRDFSGSNHKQQYKFSTLSEAHHATQALLTNMLKDTGIHNGTNSLSVLSNIHSAQSNVPSQPPPLSMSHSSTIPTSTSTLGLGIAKILQLRQKVATHKQNLVSGMKKPSLSAHSTNPQQQPQHSTHSSAPLPLGLTQPPPLIPAHHIPQPIAPMTVSCILPTPIPSESSHSSAPASDAPAVRTKRSASTHFNTSSTGQQPASKKSRPASGALHNVPAKLRAERKEKKEEPSTVRRSRRIKMQSQQPTSI